MFSKMFSKLRCNKCGNKISKKEEKVHAINRLCRECNRKRLDKEWDVIIDKFLSGELRKNK